MKKKKIIILSLILIIIFSLIIASIAKSYKEIYTENISSFSASKNIYLAPDSYLAYKEKNTKLGKEKIVKVDDISETVPGSKSKRANDGVAIICQDEGEVSWKIKVEKAGRYNIYVEYRQVVADEDAEEGYTGKGSDIEREIKINGERPFIEAKNIKFSRIYEDEKLKGNKFSKNQNGDEIRPKQIEKPEFVEHLIDDYEKYICEPLEFYFKQGENILTFVAIREPMIIRKLELRKIEEIKNYNDALNDWKQEGFEVVSKKNKEIKWEAEYIYEKNTPVLIPLKDETSPRMYPYNNGNKVKLNAVGIYSWRLPGYWLSYKITVPQKGLYALSLRGKQNIKESGFVTRQIIINNKIPFKEASYVPLKSTTDLTNYRIADGKNEYLFPLKKGENIIKFSVSLGNIGPILTEVKDLIKHLNELYIDIIKNTSATPDFNNNYDLENRIPNLKENLKKYYDRLSNVIKIYKDTYKGGAGSISSLTNLEIQLKRFAIKPEDIIYELNTFQSNISALGTWVLQEQEQPFTMDSFSFHAPKARLKRAKANIFESIWLELSRFIFSFKSRSGYAGNPNSKNRIKVWITSGRDNAQILRRIIDDELSSEDIAVDLELVQKDALLKATIAGKGPDVALSVEEGTPIDFAFRDAAYDLNTLAGIDEVKTRYHESALESFYFTKKNKKGLYALPEQQIFPVFFYRSDIFEKLGNLQVPNNFDELDTVIQKLNSNNYNFFVDSGTNTLNEQLQSKAVSNSVNAGFFPTILYQYGGSFYSDDMKKSNLGAKKSLDAFNKFTDLFTAYKIPVAANFVNRFRSGEIAAGIVDYNNYNTLAVFAPEIAGNWKIAKVPQIGDYDLASSKSVAACMILKNTKKLETSWRFLKWWTSDSVQTNYARELETVIGAAARYTTANKKALENLSWPRRDLEVIKNQMQKTKGIPQVPGGYMTTRQFINAFLSVVRDGLSPYETMDEYIVEINHAIEIKRKEFRLE